MKIEFDNIILRDMIESDIDDYVRWFTVEREWEDWDAPWEKEETCEETERKKWTEYYESLKDRPENITRWKFEIEYNKRHIGWVSSYLIDENYEWVSSKDNNIKTYRAIGICICEKDVWGNGVGTKALQAFIQYLIEHDYDELYIQTWSGNKRMLRCAEKLGFVVCNKDDDKREVNGERYDGLTLVYKK